jgi:hypothetical protein
MIYRLIVVVVAVVVVACVLQCAASARADCCGVAMRFFEFFVVLL